MYGRIEPQLTKEMRALGAAENRAKSSAQAAYMKERGIRRTTGQCPMGCGASYSIDRPSALMEHLTKCQGGGAKKRLRVVNQLGKHGARRH